MSDSYVVTPPNPKVDTINSFQIAYTTNSIPFADNATYTLVNTDSSAVLTSTMATGNMNSFPSGYSGTPYVIYGLGDYRIFLDFNSSPT